MATVRTMNLDEALSEIETLKSVIRDLVPDVLPTREPEVVKWCAGCGAHVPRSGFYSRGSGDRRPQSRCKSCTKARVTANTRKKRGLGLSPGPLSSEPRYTEEEMAARRRRFLGLSD